MPGLNVISLDSYQNHMGYLKGLCNFKQPKALVKRYASLEDRPQRYKLA